MHGERTITWRYYVCGLLLLATTINYLDRQTLSGTSLRITSELALTKEQYGWLEFAFSWAFALGASFFGWVADRSSIRWLYPGVLILWSLMGFCTGLVETYAGLIVCRTMLGLFEAGHWPCALRTTRHILQPAERTLGNSILQSGSSVGAILAPLLVKAMLTDQAGSWRMVFQVVGLAGAGWAALWLVVVKQGDLPEGRPATDDPGSAASAQGSAGVGARSSPALRDAAPPSFASVVCSRRFLALVLVVLSINACWHLFRHWMMLFLTEGRGYSESTALYFNSAYYLSSDAGCILTGLLSLWLVRRGWQVHRARVAVFTLCSLLTSASLVIPWLPAGWVLQTVLLTVGFGSLGLFPVYYALSQELAVEHQGKVTGTLGTIVWIGIGLMQPLFGSIVDRTHSYDAGLAISGVSPLVGIAALLLLWNERPAAETLTSPSQA